MPLLYIHRMTMRKSLPLYYYTSYSWRVSLFIIPLPIEYNKRLALFQVLLCNLSIFQVTFCPCLRAARTSFLTCLTTFCIAFSTSGVSPSPVEKFFPSIAYTMRDGGSWSNTRASLMFFIHLTDQSHIILGVLTTLSPQVIQRLHINHKFGGVALY